jgi:hypothetical protein
VAKCERAQGKDCEFFLVISRGTAIVQQPLHHPAGFSIIAPISTRYWSVVSRLALKPGVFEPGLVRSAGLHSIWRMFFRRDIDDETVGPGSLRR